MKNTAGERFNVSIWGLRNRALVLYIMAVLTLTGLYAYSHLSQSEDPPYTFNVMLVQARWPGANAEQVAKQVTFRIQKALQEFSEKDYIEGYSSAGESTVFFYARDNLPATTLKQLWDQIRKKINDMRHTLPAGTQGPFFNDDFGDVYGNIFALSAPGVDAAVIKRYAEAIRVELLRIPDIAKVVFFGDRSRRIHVDIDHSRIASMGLSISQISRALAGRSRIGHSAFYETASERIYLETSGELKDAEQIAALKLHLGGRSIRLGDIARVSSGYSEPPQPYMRFNGREALGIGIAMRDEGDIIALGKHIDRAAERIAAQLPLGFAFERVSDQPKIVSKSVNEFVNVLIEAVAIVMIVSLLSLGFRTGMVILIIIPVVLAITFLIMYFSDIGLHKVSLGALIIALGLLVDDAIIAIEMMATKIEQGWDRFSAAGFAYNTTAMPMLAGTLVTVAGFLPIALARSSVGEYTRSIFEVTSIALLISWIAAILFVPWLGYYLLPAHHENGKQSLLLRLLGRRQKNAPPPPPAAAADDIHAIYLTPFYRRLRAFVQWCVHHSSLVIAATLVIFVASLFVFERFVPQQFFPDSSRPELLLTLKLSEGASHEATAQAAAKIEALLQDSAETENHTAWIGSGSPRFYLPLDQQMPLPGTAQFVIVAKDQHQREILRSRLIEYFEDTPLDFRGTITRLENGPPVGFPVQYRISGPNPHTLYAIGERVAAVMREHAALSNVHLNWGAPVKTLQVIIDQAKAHALGLDTAQLSEMLEITLHGRIVGQVREHNELINITVRGGEHDRSDPARLASLALASGDGRSITLGQIARIETTFSPSLIWQRDTLAALSARATLYGTTQPATVVADLHERIDALRAGLDTGYRIEDAGSVEESSKSMQAVLAGAPVLVFIVLTILMFQLRSFSRVAMVLLTAPLGNIGITVFLLVFQQPFGFVAMLGAIALTGMIMRNSVILVDQIEQDRRDGHSTHNAIVEATVRRFRPIVLTALTAILAMIPLSRSDGFFGPMAVAIMGGLAIATVLTIIFLPALYAAWTKITGEYAASKSTG